VTSTCKLNDQHFAPLHQCISVDRPHGSNAVTNHTRSLSAFPPDLRTAPLESISLSNLEAGDQDVSCIFFDACRNLGFFYLDLTGSELGESIIRDAESLHALQQDFFALPHEIKDKYGRD
jgi:hypothetical protein